MNPNCPSCGAPGSAKHGRFYRHDDAQIIQRYRCVECGKTHSSATHTDTYRQKRRRINRSIEVDIASSTSQRRIALNHGCDRKTVARKIEFLAKRARARHSSWLKQQEPFDVVQWDELITFEHTRLKPLSIAVMSCERSRCLIGYGVAQIPASGKIAKRSVEKYGKRRDFSGGMRRGLLKELAPHLLDSMTISTDEHKRYPKEIKDAYPEATHIRHLSKRGSLTGQGELKRTGYDPLFNINHNLAMIRDNIKRLARRTWCTTKKVDVLDDIMAIYVHHHNIRLVA